MKMTRRTAIGILATSAAVEQIEAQTSNTVSINWLGNTAPSEAVGVSWGVPWPRGAFRREQSFSLTANNQPLPLQTWPLAFWPDGSLKFSGFATVAGAAGPYRLAPGTPTATTPIRITQSAQAIEIDTGKVQAHLPRSRASLIDTLTIDGRVVAR